MALGAIVSASTVTKCDVCEKVTGGNAFRPPVPWVAIEIRGGDVWASTETHHACSKECAARLFYRLADKSGGIPATADRRALETGHPFR